MTKNNISKLVKGTFLYSYSKSFPDKRYEVELVISKVENHTTPYVIAVISNPMITAHLYPKETWEEILYPLLQDFGLTQNDVTFLHYFHSKTNIHHLNIWEFTSYLETYSDDQLKTVNPELVCEELRNFHMDMQKRILSKLAQE